LGQLLVELRIKAMQPELIPEPALCKLKASPVQVVGSGISQRAAAARSQTVWRWLVQKGINMKKKETTWEDVIDFAVKKKITPEEFTQILIDSNEEVGIDKKQLQVLKKTLSEMDE
tara:strand:- start:130 stop:477 length:348 start_codon:yes stop_codon:yes gene_type:complete